ncbi:MAG: hypothetical protein IT435_02275 [Phycisphaerales bacterium]|nr:hypothetical protein [Phycisphaerales bacterium]
MNKIEVARRAGVDLTKIEQTALLPAKEEADSIGKKLQRRAGYGKVDERSLATYLKALRQCGTYCKAALAANLSYQSILNHRKSDPEFAALETEAKELWIAETIDEPFKKFGLEGVNRIIIDRLGNRHEGEKVIQPQIALAFARKFDPAYREKQELDVNHRGGVVVVTAPLLTEADLEKHARKLEAEKLEIVADQLPDAPPAGTLPA